MTHAPFCGTCPILQLDLSQLWGAYARKTDAGALPPDFRALARRTFRVSFDHKFFELSVRYMLPAEEQYIAALTGALPGEL